MNGLLLIDKPGGVTSHDVVARVRRILKTKSVGHTGTLDPLATGLMILVLGEATKISEYLVAEQKAYDMRVRLGVRTDSLDITGQILAEKHVDLPESEILTQAKALIGDFEWPIPIFSAKRVNGQKLYERAHAGVEMPAGELPTKRMSYWDLHVRSVGANFLDVNLSCSTGTFMRTWAAQLGESLGVGGVVESLRRTRVGDWRVERAVTLEALEAMMSSTAGAGLDSSVLMPMTEALPHMRAVMAGPKEAKLIGNGQIARDLENRLIFAQKQAFSEGQPVFVKVLSTAGELLAILAAQSGQGLKIRRVFRAFA